MSAPATTATEVPPAKRGEWRTVGVLWWTYGAYYFCRTNLSAAIPGLKASLGAGGLGLTPDEIGWIQGSNKVSYGVGQLFNGQFSERFSPRKLLATGMIVSALLNVLFARGAGQEVFGLKVGFYSLMVVWAANGYFQSLGWTPCMRVAANWVPVLRRGRAIGVIGTGYQMTQGLTYVVAGWAAHEYGWRGALYVPAGLLIFAAVVMLLLLEEGPREESQPDAVDVRQTSVSIIAERGSWTENILVTLSNGRLWLLGISLGLLNACRYGFIDWGLTHLKEVQVTTVKDAALKYALLPVGAMAGSYIAGWMTDRFFGGRRAPVICLLLLALSALSLIYSEIVTSSPTATLALLVAIGFCIYGPQVLLVGTAPADLARRGTSAAAAGFVNFLGYMGAASGDVVTGYLLKHYDWTTTIYVWGGWAFAAAIAAALLWNATAHQESATPPEPEA